jgi:hypothetical protein
MLTGSANNEDLLKSSVRYDLLHVLYAGMLLNFSSAEIRSFWNKNLLPGYSSTDEFLMFTELWQGRKWYPQIYVFSVLNNFEPFLLASGQNIFDFINNPFQKINKGLLISPRDWLAWSKSVLPLFFSKEDIRFLALKLLDHYNSKIARGLRYSIVHHTIENNCFKTTMMLSMADLLEQNSPLPKFDCELWSAFFLSKLPTAVNLPAYDNYFMLSDYRDVLEIVPEIEVSGDHLCLNSTRIAQRIPFRTFCLQNKIEINTTRFTDHQVWIMDTDYSCPIRKRIVLHKGCAYNAPVYLFGYIYAPVSHSPLNFLDTLIDDITQYKDNLWTEIKGIHKRFMENLNPKVTIVYDRKHETIHFNGDYLIKNVPAKIFRKMLCIYIETGRSQFQHSEFVKDESIIENPHNPNFVVRLQRLSKALKLLDKGISIDKTDKGIFSLSTICKIDYSECN